MFYIMIRLNDSDILKVTGLDGAVCTDFTFIQIWNTNRSFKNFYDEKFWN